MAKDGQITETLKLKVINKKVQPTYTVEKNQVGLSVSKEQLSNVYQDIPADFKTIVDDGGKLTVILKSEVINNQELLTQLNNQLKQQEIMKDYQIGQWLDINIVAEIQSVEGNKQTELLTDLSKPLEIKIAIPQELLAKNREYAIVRIHEGKAEVLDTQLSSDQKYLMFKSDRFSEYAIIYRDIDNHKQQNKDENTVSTDDTTMIGMEIMGMIVSGLIVVLSYKKKKYL